MEELNPEMKERVDTLIAIDEPVLAGAVQCAFIAGMQLAIRVCRNRAADIRQAGKIMTMAGNEAETCASLIRIMQVEIGSGRSARPKLTKEELEEMDRIS
jgi:hypothetical protein